MDYPPLKNASIREAILDFRARVPDEDVDRRIR